MSHANKKSPVIIVGQGSKAHLLHGAKLRLIITVLVLTIAAGSLSGYILIHNRVLQKKKTEVTFSNLDNIVQNANKQAFKGGGATGLGVYDNAIANAKDPNTLGNLYMQKATLALNTNSLDEALSAALKGDQVLKSEGSSSLVATVYEKRGDKAQAAVYYRKAATLIPPDQISGFTSQYYLSKAQQLSGAKQ